MFIISESADVSCWKYNEIRTTDSKLHFSKIYTIVNFMLIILHKTLSEYFG